MTQDQLRELVKECGLDWHRGFMPLFDGDDTNRYAVLIEAAMAHEREQCALVCDQFHKDNWPAQNKAQAIYCAGEIRARGKK